MRSAVFLFSRSAHTATALRALFFPLFRSAARNFLLAVLLMLPGLGGCGLLTRGGDAGPRAADAQQTESGGEAEHTWQGAPVPYALGIEIRGRSPEANELRSKMKDVSQLVRLAKEPPDSLLGLERRARADTESALKLLHSQCYYDGRASFSLDDAVSPARVTLLLEPGPRYTVGRADVRYDPAPDVPEPFKNRSRETGFWGLEREALPPPSFPSALPGVTVGRPVTADAMLAAVEALPERLRREGYPLARVVDARYSLNREARTLNADILVRPGPPALMGAIRVRGAKEVSAEYLQRLTPWAPGEEPWDSELLEEYANTLRGLGLFRSVEAAPAASGLEKSGEKSGVDALPADIAVAEAPFRSISGGVRYDTDTGLGLEGAWEHRNLFHNGEKLTVTAPLATEIQGIRAVFEKPAFLAREQRLLASASALREDTSAYRKMAVNASAGLERRLSRRWWGGLSLFVESGSLKDNENSEHAYGVLSPRANLRRDSRNNVLNPSSGSEVEIRLTPFTGFYQEPFSVMAGSVAASVYYAPMRDKAGRPDDRLVLAGRVEGGAMSGSALRSIPSSMRYYAGGAGSVRGYAYQALGPRDHEDEPLGGRSYQVVNLEARFKITENIGLAPFLDGGMVYTDEFPRIIGDMDWGAGLGLRYYTPIGPVRLDVAAPLRRIDGDPPVQVYISIGQSF
ncbi:autotransporter assembly complex protein TamA [Desulfovibrio sp. SGI.169]|uniref:autotransporter assembly complex protein TamA n=1 Tax=Desulfovibrio sp. SGI.169 TaxID=3420561 RepID=UPI003D03DE3E